MSNLQAIGCCCLIAFSGCAGQIVNAQSAPTPPTAQASTFVGAAGPEVEARWREPFNAFAIADAERPPPHGGIVFVGSSSIRLWSDLPTPFGPTRPSLNRGFGGSRLIDCVQHLDRLVLQYRPRMVVVYAGDNDLAEGRTPQQVLVAFAMLVDGVARALPATRVAFISIKPSPLRKLLLPQVRAANALVRDFVAQRAENASVLAYIDIYSAMVDAQGQPLEDLYLPDQLHLNARGYALWRQAIEPTLAPPPAAAPTRSARVPPP